MIWKIDLFWAWRDGNEKRSLFLMEGIVGYEVGKVCEGADYEGRG